MRLVDAAFAVGAMLMLAGCSQPAPATPETKPAARKVLYENDHLRFVEYTLYPGANAVTAVPHHSVMMTDSVAPEVTETVSGEAASPAETSSKTVLPFDSRPYPNCRVESPRVAKVVTVKGDFPQHYYRIEYKRLDGKDYAANWKTWYADVFAPPAAVVENPGLTLKGKEPYSAAWPYNVGYSSTTAAPANHTVRFQDDHVELIEVAIRPGETENMHGHPYPSVYADDGGFMPAGASYSNQSIEKDFTVPWGDLTSPFDAGTFPICFSAIPEPPHRVSVNGGPPQHFYRVHFKRVDGEDIKANWRTWYARP
jgi:hypothetical protein